MAIKSGLYLIAAAALLALLLNAHASSLSNYLLTYIPNATVSSATFHNTTLNGNSYIIMRVSAGGYIIIENASGSYSLVTNTSTIKAILTPFLLTGFYPSTAQLTYLNSTMLAYKRYSSPNITDCLTLTGIQNPETGSTYVCSTNFSATSVSDCLQNTCDTIPICGGHLKSPRESELQAFPPPSTFTYGLQNLSIINNNLTTDYDLYFFLLSSINTTNSGTVISKLSSIVSGISNIMQTINNNPLFPPPPGATYAACNPLLQPTQEPPDCIANYAQYCTSIPTDPAELAGVSSMLSTLQSELPSAAGIALISSNSSTAAQNYINAELQQTNGAVFDRLLATVTPKFNTILNKSKALLSRYDNNTLSQSLLALQAKYNAVVSAGVNQNVSLANRTLQLILANTSSVYNKSNAYYNRVYATSQNNSAALLTDQLNYQQVPVALAVMASEQQEINAKLNSGIDSNDVASLSPEIQNIQQGSAMFSAPLSAGYIIKAFDEPFITAILGSSNEPIPGKTAAAPLYAMLESLIIGIVVIAVISAIIFLRVIKKGRLKNNRNMKNLMIKGFVLLIGIVIIFSYATYAYASSAVNFLPFSYFMSSLKASGTAYVALNGSAATNSSIIACANTIENYIKNAGKSVQIIKLTNYSCISGSNISTLGLDCYDGILGSNRPVIFISQSQQNNITYKGLYGTVLYASGNLTVGRYCTLGSLFKNV